MVDEEKEARILAANPVLKERSFMGKLQRWEAARAAGLKAGLAADSAELADWIAYWMTDGAAGKLP